MNDDTKEHIFTITNPVSYLYSGIPGAGIYYNDFYALPSPIAIVVGIISAFIIIKGTIKEKTSTFLEGCGDRNILTMCIIYILAGAFATVSKSIGSVDAIVNIGINNLSPQYYPAGIFFVASFCQ